MPLICTNTDGRRRRYRVATEGTKIILEQVMLVACQDIITLSARLLDKSDQPHTFYWEQISGASVEWLEDRNQLMVMWRQPTDRGDKIFRFWVDRTTSREMYQDLLVTPLNREPMRLPQDGEVNFQYLLPEQYLPAGSIVPMPAPRINNPGGVVVDASDRAVTFTWPNYQTFMQGIEVQSGIDGELSTTMLLTPKPAGTKDILENISLTQQYRFNTVFNYANQKTDIGYSAINVFSRKAAHELDGFEDSTIRLSCLESFLSSDVIERQLAQLRVDPDSFSVISSDANHIALTMDVITRSLISAPAIEDSLGNTSSGGIFLSVDVAEQPGVVLVG